MDQQLDDANLLSGEKLLPERVEPLKSLTDDGLREFSTRGRHGAPCGNDDLGRLREAPEAAR